MIIDGSYGEAGGQILRTSIALASLFKKDIKIINIRKGRKPPGLKSQHLHAINLLRKITNAEVEGLNIGSIEIYFKPNGIKEGYFEENIGTAGSITLLLQAVILPSLFSNIELRIIGGTDVKHSPSLDYFRYVILPYLERFANIKFKVIRRGFYPRGGGEIYVKIKPKININDYNNFEEFLKDVRNLGRLDLFESNLKKIYIYSVATKDLKDRKVAERMLNSAKGILKRLNIKIIENIEYVSSLSTGAVITIVGEKDKYYFGSDSLGEKGKSAEMVGKEAAEKFLKVINKNVSIDENLADNLIPYLGLVGGYFSTTELTGHLHTNIWVCEKFFGKIYEVIEDDNVIVKTKF